MKVSTKMHKEQSNSNYKNWLLLFIGLVIGTMLVCCICPVSNYLAQHPYLFNIEKSFPPPPGCDGITWGSSIDVGYNWRLSKTVARIEGDLPDSCSVICGSEQVIRGRELNINLYSSQEEDKKCSQISTSFVEVVPLNEQIVLLPGEYTITLNGDHATTTWYLK